MKWSATVFPALKRNVVFRCVMSDLDILRTTLYDSFSFHSNATDFVSHRLTVVRKKESCDLPCRRPQLPPFSWRLHRGPPSTHRRWILLLPSDGALVVVLSVFLIFPCLRLRWKSFTSSAVLLPFLRYSKSCSRRADCGELRSQPAFSPGSIIRGYSYCTSTSQTSVNVFEWMDRSNSYNSCGSLSSGHH